jgi:hypothetical protein
MQLKLFAFIIIDLAIIYFVFKLLFKSVGNVVKKFFDPTFPSWQSDYGLRSTIKILIFSATIFFLVWIEKTLFY